MTELEQLRTDLRALRVLRTRFSHMTKDEADAVDRAIARITRQSDLLDDAKYRTVRVLVLYGRSDRYEATSLVDMEGRSVDAVGAIDTLHEFLEELEVPFEEAVVPAVITARVPRLAPVEVEGHVE